MEQRNKPFEEPFHRFPASMSHRDLVKHIEHNSKSSSPRWSCVRETQHSVIHVDRIKGKNYDGVRTTCNFAVPAPFVLTYFLDPLFRSQWDAAFDYSTIVEEIDDDTVVWRLVFKSPISLMKPRDAVVRMTTNYSPAAGRYVIEYHSVDHPSCPPDPRMIRAAVMPGSGAIITPLDVHGSPSPTLQTTMCQATQVEYLDFRGKTPLWLVGSIAQRLASSFDKFRKVAEQRFSREHAMLSKEGQAEADAANRSVMATFPAISPAALGSMTPVSPTP
ncbi:hypothetical protein J8273_4228 [Carpediemonas membranifera]|uniref:START domain-containing protein n=1 Tax=Carpediemonas membranifera TaxID=201153 RepID=A0A8J6ATF3_9EUKA|nr:hypothetical protein J8273_4228 [Carpediemonas membranifera]|eukprot:KAG9394126.1 hypothetical protein J8273_4228 [Carpediemonas membranifera]